MDGRRPLLVPVLQVLQTLAQGLELRVSGVLPQPTGQLDRYLLGLLLGIGIAENGIEQIGVEDQRVKFGIEGWLLPSRQIELMVS
jgi:hypothetical protein